MVYSERTAAQTSTDFNHLIYIPENRDPSVKLPLVVFLHGAGERGNDFEALSVHGPFKKILKEGWKPDFINLAPQCPEGSHWNDKTEALKVFIDGIIEKYNADPARIYITGLSMGGFGTWAMLSRWGNFFAAGMPICGGGMPWTAFEFCGVPVWAFHGEADSVVNVRYSRDMIAAIKSLSAESNYTEPKYTEYPGVDHDSWTETYANSEAWAWLLAQRKK